jgi:RNA polymerase sigma-70 factor (ECF subfamily)
MTTRLDEAVRDALAHKDENRAVELVWRELGRRVARFLSAMFVDVPADAEDAFADWAVNLVTALPRFEWRSSLTTYAFCLARRSAARVIADRRHHAAEPLRTTHLSGIAQEMWLDTLRALPDALRDDLRALRETLDEEERAILLLFVHEELPWKEVVQILCAEEVLADGAALNQENARLRARWSRAKAKLEAAALDAGLVDRMDNARVIIAEMRPRR